MIPLSALARVSSLPLLQFPYCPTHPSSFRSSPRSGDQSLICRGCPAVGVLSRRASARDLEEIPGGQKQDQELLERCSLHLKAEGRRQRGSEGSGTGAHLGACESNLTRRPTGPGGP